MGGYRTRPEDDTWEEEEIQMQEDNEVWASRG